MSVPALDPYAILRIGRDATREEINAAFRRRAKETHPDHGGDPAEFSRVKTAHRVLSDADRRAEFDRSGTADDVGPAPNPDDGAYKHINEMIAAAIGGDDDPTQHDLVQAICDALRQKAQHFSAEVAKLNAVLSRAKRLKGRFSRLGDGENVLDSMVSWHVRQIEDLRAKRQADIKDINRGIEIVRQHGFRRDPPAPPPPFDFHPMQNTSSTATSLGSIFGFGKMF